MNEISITKSIPINIPNQLKPKSEQYSLNHMFFDPAQNSPPSIWKMRLNKRVGENPIKNVNNVNNRPLSLLGVK